MAVRPITMTCFWNDVGVILFLQDIPILTNKKGGAQQDIGTVGLSEYFSQTS